MRRVTLDGRTFSGRRAAIRAAGAAVGAPEAENLDALNDVLTSICEPTELTVEHAEAARDALGTAADELLRVLREAAEDNDRLTVAVREAPVSAMAAAVARGDVVRRGFDPARIPLYLGSGSCGALFDAFGLVGAGPLQTENAGTFQHADHYARGRWGLDYWLGLFRMAFSYGPPKQVRNYVQRLSLFTGRLETAFTAEGKRWRSSVGFDPERRDLMVLELEGPWDLVIAPCVDARGGYGERFTLGPAMARDGFAFRTGRSETSVRIRADGAAVSLEGAGIRVKVEREARIVVGAAAADRAGELAEELAAAAGEPSFFAASAAAWRRRWGDAFLSLSDDRLQAMWARSVYYLFCSLAPTGAPSAPMGWTGLGWHFGFPQDVSYLHPALLRLGHTDLAKGIVEFYRSRLDDMTAMTSRLYGGRGAMWAWEFPIGRGGGALAHGAPNVYQFEIHNAAYPARMALETARTLKDEKWTAEVAAPVVRASAEFYASHLTRGDDGRWSLAVTPSMSQDEYGQADGRNYLCALYSARYAFAAACELGMEEFRRYLDDGLAFDRLADGERGVYRPAETARDGWFGGEKHPVQLNPLTFLPWPTLNGYERRAYDRRYEICGPAARRDFRGWTLMANALASSHLGEAEELMRELDMAFDPDYTDPERLEFYESSFCPGSAYYVTSHGLFLQALNDAFVCDVFGRTELEKAVPKALKGSRYEGLRTADGRRHSGTV